MSWLSCCIARGDQCLGRTGESLAAGSEGAVPQTQRAELRLLPQRCPLATHFWQQLVLVSALISVGSQPAEQSTATAGGTPGCGCGATAALPLACCLRDS